VKRHRIGLINGEFHIAGFPESVKLIDVSGLAPHSSRQLTDMVLHHADLQFANECLQALSGLESGQPMVSEAL